MKPSRHLYWVRVWSAALLACLVLPGCLGSPRVKDTPVPSFSPTAVEDQTSPQPTGTPTMPPTPEPPKATPQPSATPLPSATATQAGVPDLLEGFPLFTGAQVDPASAYADETSAGLLIHTSKSPGELDVFYRQALETAGWTLRYSEGNPVGGFLQEWRKGDSWLTVEYLFQENQPVVQADLRVIDSKQALVVLFGFPLPNGTVVTSTDGPSIELYVPQEYDNAVKYFVEKMYERRWKVQEIKLDEHCASRACFDTAQPVYSQVATLDPTPTPDAQRKPVTYLVTMRDLSQARITFLPHRENTRVYVDVNWNNWHRARLPMPPYPNGEIQSVKPNVLLFTTSDSLQTVVEHYKVNMPKLGWKIDPNAIFIEKEAEYHNTWMKRGQYVTITLSRTKGVTHATLTCRGCWEAPW